MRRLAYTILAAVLCLLVAQAAQGAEATTKDRLGSLLQARQRLLCSNTRMKDRQNWTRCIDGFVAFHKADPEGGDAPRALMMAGDLYVRLYHFSGSADDLGSGLDLLARTVKGYPESSIAPEAQYLMADAYRRGGRLQEAAGAFGQLLKAYPRSPRAKAAKRDLAALKRAGVVGLAKASSEGSQPEPQAQAQTQPTPQAGNPVVVEDVKRWSATGYTRIVISLSGTAAFEGHLLKKGGGPNTPRRLYVDIKPARRGHSLEDELPVNDAFVMKARTAQYAADTVRVVLDVKDVESYKVFPLQDPFRIVIDVRGDKQETQEGQQGSVELTSAKVGEVRPEPPKPQVSAPPPAASKAEQLGLRVARVIIDAGHGGKDPGAIGPGGVREKDVVLEIARLLAAHIRQELGCEVILTRDSDVFLPLEERTAIANTRKGDLFISIHANACVDPKGHGIETYFLNFTTDKESMRVAARENATTFKNLSDLQLILHDLMLHSKINESSRLADHIQGSLVGQLRGRYSEVADKGVKKAPFYVLIGAQMPSVLVETAFITNRTEAERLASNAYRDLTAAGIVAGIKEYIKEIETAARR
jgi:N-acetylmuramoyl-L-alanine amidase